MSAAPKISADQAAAIGFRKAVPPEPKIYAQCRNCKRFGYDHEDYMSLRGTLCFRKSNLQCGLHKISVQLGTVCNAHEFAYSDRSDR